MSRRAHRALLLLGAVAVTAACGTTVQERHLIRVSDAAANGSSELNAGTPPGDAGATTGADSQPTGTTSSAGGGTVIDPAAPAAAGPAGLAPTTKTAAGPTKAAGKTHVAGKTTVTSKTSAAPKTPITIGVVTTGTSNSSQYGASQGNSVTEQSVDSALIDAMNKSGGLSGRRIVPVYAHTDTGSTSWDSDFEAACASFTQDNHVAAVLGYEFTYIAGFETCLAQAGIVHLNTGYNIPDATELAPYPLFRALQVPTIEERQLAKFQGAIATGSLTKSSKVGVVLDSCPGTERSWDSISKPFLVNHGITVAYSTTAGCPDGANASAASAVSSLSNAVVAMRSAGVDTVAFPDTSEGPLLLLFSEAAEAQSYRPTYLVSSLANLAVLGPQAPAAQMANVKGFGWIPSEDVAPSQYGPLNASQQRCVALIKSQGITLAAPADYAYAFSICEPMFAYEKALAATNGNTSGAAIVGAVDAFGTSFQSVTNLDGASTFGPNRKNLAPAHVRELVWATSCSCFQYTGDTRSMP